MNGGGNQERTGHLSSPSRPLSRATHSRGILFFFWTVGQTGVCRRFLSCHQIPELFTGLCHVRKWPFSDKTGNRKPVVIPRSVSLFQPPESTVSASLGDAAQRGEGRAEHPADRQRLQQMHALVPNYQQAVRTRPRSAGRLSTIASGRAANDDDFGAAVRRGGASLALQQAQAPPWQSRAVARLASAAVRGNKEGRGASAAHPGEKVEPMLIEGPRGTSLRALGSKDDHKVAGDALSKALAEQRERRARGGLAQFAPSSRPPRDRAFEAEDVPSSVARRGQRQEMVFGAVYEHCDSTGRPKIISSTSTMPEQQFLLDGQSHRHVADLLTRQRGSSRVVWAGVGQASAGVGEAEMGSIRNAIVEDRSKRLQLQKLGGIKPYSAHGW